MAGPARIEWWGDDISSVRMFDLTTQRSAAELADVTVLPITSAGVRTDTWSTERLKRSTLFDLLPGDSLLLEELASQCLPAVDPARSDA